VVKKRFLAKAKDLVLECLIEHTLWVCFTKYFKGEFMNIIPFNYGTKEIRVLQDANGEPLWVAKDVCEVLGYEDTKVALRKLDDDEKLKSKIYSSGQTREMTCINESGLYTLILRSNKPEAKVFKKWVTKEVLPAIRKSGSYSLGNQNESLKVVMAGLENIAKSLETVATIQYEILQEIKSLRAWQKSNKDSNKISFKRDRLSRVELEVAFKSFIEQNPGANQTDILKAFGKKRDDKQGRKILSDGVGELWVYVLDGRAKRFYPIKKSVNIAS